MHYVVQARQPAHRGLMHCSRWRRSRALGTASCFPRPAGGVLEVVQAREVDDLHLASVDADIAATPERRQRSAHRFVRDAEVARNVSSAHPQPQVQTRVAERGLAPSQLQQEAHHARVDADRGDRL